MANNKSLNAVPGKKLTDKLLPAQACAGPRPPQLPHSIEKFDIASVVVATIDLAAAPIAAIQTAGHHPRYLSEFTFFRLKEYSPFDIVVSTLFVLLRKTFP